MTDHPGEMADGPGSGFWILHVLLVAAGCYVLGVQRLRARHHRWPITRSIAAGAALSCLALAALPVPPGTGFAGHAAQHLLLAMLAPLLLAFSAPVTLALRTAAVKPRRLLLVLLHSRFVGLLTTAPAVVVLSVGGVFTYYLTPLYDLAHRNDWAQGLAHLHMFLAGCLLSWYLIGRDPLPRRPTLPAALVVLLITAAGHDLLAKVLYAQSNTALDADPARVQLGAQIMYYGGNAVEVLLAVVVMGDWYRRTGRRLERDRRHQLRVAARSDPAVPGTPRPDSPSSSTRA